ncbi:MAG: histidine triad nucleotide-binding protein [Brachymonas sp.]|jgi:histidine triad (HIT) family protein|nr:histidine triad nucleotide-binding protein [Brachymonas sp.]MBP6138037.1 histidine triad nucleotide-binding protein [Brachymonas sp.]MBP6966676.1 histidine triad nucleotide-binding protein [Brachymonas sp.]MBP7246839.1 histidine triad nucleotide-binding protein [Brachymonas sp.]MBP7743700.1 histidine triad nucleotide-binding protein [Brachymonas sp.]
MTSTATNNTTATDCIFCKIAAGQIPSRKVYEDEDLLAFHDIAPWAPVHLLVIPKRHIASMAQITPQDSALMGKIMTLAPQLALDNGCEPYPQGGYRIVINTGTHGGQEVHHLHVHIIGGPRPWKQG